MSTAILEQPSPETGIVKMNVTDQEIAKLKAEYLPLTVNGLEDKAGLKAVYDARQVVKKLRVELVKHAKGLRDDAVAWQKKVIAEENRVVGELKTIEDHLQAEEDKVAAEKERLRKEAEDAENARIQVRIDKLAEYGFKVEYALLKSIDDESFEKVLANAKTEYEKELAAQAERDRLAAEEAARLKAEREELEELRRKQAEAQAIIDAENARKAKEHADREAAIAAEEKRVADEAAAVEAKKREDERIAQAREDARIRAIEEAKQAEEHRIAEEKRQAALRPDKEKLEAFAKRIGQIIDFDVKDPKAQLIMNDISTMIGKMQIHILKKIKEL